MRRHAITYEHTFYTNTCSLSRLGMPLPDRRFTRIAARVERRKGAQNPEASLASAGA
jgi:hypothetical protein